MKKTFDEWRADGYRVKKGSKSVGRNKDGVPLFADFQVWHPKWADRNINHAYMMQRLYGDVDYEDSIEWDSHWMSN